MGDDPIIMGDTGPVVIEGEAAAAYWTINSDIVPEVLRFFEGKQRTYGGGPAFQFLGVKGQFSDINRKFWKLYRALWEGESIEGEQPEEILMDLIGHCLLTIYCLRKEPHEDRPKLNLEKS